MKKITHYFLEKSPEALSYASTVVYCWWGKGEKAPACSTSSWIIPGTIAAEA